jgi:GT2 family glycosyltransferase
MAIISVACYDTVENNRTWMTKETLLSLYQTVDLDKHRLFVIDNASCQATKELLFEMERQMKFTLITNKENIGTAKAINQGWRHRNPGEHLIKQDNDCVHHQAGWVDLLEEAIERDPRIGQASCKRKDLEERPDATHPFYKSELIMLPGAKGHKWIVAEFVKHCLGTCVMHNYRLIDKVGGLYQMESVYAFDDALMSLRSTLAGFYNTFIPSIEIDHIDPGDNPYQKEKQELAGKLMDLYGKTAQEFKNGTRSLYCEL